MWTLGEYAASPADSNATSPVIDIQGRRQKHWHRDFVQHHLRNGRSGWTSDCSSGNIRAMYILSLGHLCLSWVLHYALRSQRCMSSHACSHSPILPPRLVWRFSLMKLKANSIIL